MGCNHSKIACGCGNHIVDRDGKEYCLPSCQTEVSIEKAERELLRFKARQLLAAKKGHLKARGYKRGSKPTDNARVYKAPLNPIKKFLGIDTVEAIFDRLITAVVNGKQVRPFHENNQTSTEHEMRASNDTVPEQIKTSGSILELRNQEKQDARYKEVAKKFVNGVLCRAMDVMARAAERSTSSPAEHSRQLREDLPTAPSEKGIKIPDAVKIFVDDIISNAADVVRAEMLLSAGPVDVMPDTIAKDIPKEDVEKVDEQEIQVPEILEKDPENLDVLKDEQLAMVWVNWSEVKVNVDAEVKERPVDVMKDYENQVVLTVECAEEDRNVDLQTKESGYITVNWDQVKVSVDGQVKVGPEVSEDQVFSTEASAKQDSNVDLQTEECGYDMVCRDQVKVSVDGQVKVGPDVSEEQESFIKASAKFVQENQALVKKDSIPRVLVEWKDVKLSIDGEIRRGIQTREVIADKVQVKEVAQEQKNVEEEEDIPQLVMVKWEAVNVLPDGVIRDGTEAKRIKQSEDQMSTTQDVTPKRDVTNATTSGSKANESKKQEGSGRHERQEMSKKNKESLATGKDNLAVAMGDSYALADSEDAVPVATALLPRKGTNAEKANIATAGLLDTNSSAKGNCIKDEIPNAEDGKSVHAKVYDILEEEAIPDEKDGTKKVSTVQKKELSFLTEVMTKDEVFEDSMSYYTRLLEDMASNEERDTQRHAQVRDPIQYEEENSIVRPDDGRLPVCAPIEGETRKIHEVFATGHQNDDDAHGTSTREGGKSIFKTADLGHDVMDVTREDYIGNDDANSKRETIVGPDDGRRTKNAEIIQDTERCIEDCRGNGTQTGEGEKPMVRPGDGLFTVEKWKNGKMEDTMGSIEYSRRNVTEGQKYIARRPGDGLFTIEKSKNENVKDTMGSTEDFRSNGTEGELLIARPGDGEISKSDYQLPTLNDFTGIKQASDGNINQRKKDNTCERQKGLSIGSVTVGNWRPQFVDEITKKSSSLVNINGKNGNTSEIRGILWNESINPLGSWAPKPITVADYMKSGARPKEEIHKKKTPSLDFVDGWMKKKVATRVVYSIPKEPANINPPPFIVPLDSRKVSRKPSAAKMKNSLVYRINNQNQKDAYDYGVPSLPGSKSTEDSKQQPLECLSASLSRLGSRFTSSNHKYKYTKVNTVEDGKKRNSTAVNPAPLKLRCRDEILYEKDNNKDKKEYECDAEDIALAIEEFNHTRQVLSFDGLVSTALVHKFLLARDFVVGDATSLYKNYLSLRRTYYRAELNPLDDPLQSELFSGRFTVLDSRDQHGAAIAVFTAHLHGVDINHEIVMNNIFLQLDETMKSVETQRQGMILIYDFSNITYKTCDVHLCSKILELFLSAYPVRLKKTFIVSPPFWFESEMRLISAVFRDTTYRKDIHIVTQSGLKENLPIKCIPGGLGGDCETNPMRLIERCISSHKDRTGMTETKVERSSHVGEMMSCDSQRNVFNGEEQEKDEKDSERPTVYSARPN